ncbi:MAG: hypothetical protein ACRDZ4_15210 [Egibacteraceae bacterium]
MRAESGAVCHWGTVMPATVRVNASPQHGQRVVAVCQDDGISGVTDLDPRDASSETW